MAIKAQQDLPIGVFDSGMGGLTVLRALREAMPNESFVYLGDTARLPYGSKSPATVRRYAEQCAALLLEQSIKLLVIACNTASIAALDHLQQRYPDVPIVGVIEPGAQAAVANSQHHRIAVLATDTTVASNAYQEAIRRLAPNALVTALPCGLFVALAEAGHLDDEIAMTSIHHYCQPLLTQATPPDCVLLGCTHFPVLRPALAAVFGPEIPLIDSASTTAVTVTSTLKRLGLVSTMPAKQASAKFMVTDSVDRFIQIGAEFLGAPIAPDCVVTV